MFTTNDYINMIENEIKEEDFMPTDIQMVVRRFANYKEEYKLRLCTFCGNKKHLFIDSSNDLTISRTFHIHCSLCRCNGPKMPTVALAVKAWNYAHREVWMEV